MTTTSSGLDKEIRKTGVTASEIADVCGMRKGAVEVYLRKRGLVDDDEMEAEWLEIGLAVEPAVAFLYEKRTGIKLVGDGRTTMVHPKHPWMMATPDRLSEDGSRVVEIKSAGMVASGKWGEPGTDEIPEEYLLQVAWQMAVTDRNRADIAVLKAGFAFGFDIYTVERDLELEEMLIERGRAFWFGNVLAGNAPDPRDVEEASRLMKSRWTENRINDLVEADDDVEMWAAELKEVRAIIGEAEERKLALETKLQGRIADHDGLMGSFGKITWKKSKDSEVVDHKALIATLDPKIVEPFKKVRPGSRRFLTQWAKEEER